MKKPDQARVLRADSHCQMGWENDLGMTTEIMVYPSGNGMANFAWRVDITTVSLDGLYPVDHKPTPGLPSPDPVL